jgi:hypothetical protein
MSVGSGYRLTGRRTGTVLLGLAVPQVVLAAAGVAAAVLLAAGTGSTGGVVAGLLAAAGCAVLAFAAAGGRPAYQAAPTLAVFAVRRATGRLRWTAPLPLLTGTPEQADGSGRRPAARPASGSLPKCLAGLELMAVPRPDWAAGGRTIAPVGLVADRRSGALTVVVGVRGSGFSLLEPAEQQRRLAGWAQVLSQFARERSPVTRLGWSLWSAPTPPSEHLGWLDGQTRAGDADAPARADYRRLLADAARLVAGHQLRVWLTVDPRAAGGDPAALPDAAMAAARALIDRCTAVGLVCSPPLSPVQIAEAMRVQADPAVAATLARVRGGLAERWGGGGTPPPPPAGRAKGCGLASPLHPAQAGGAGGLPAVPAVVHAGPLAVEAYWDAVRVDGAWHRVFWVAQWPATSLTAGWWEPLLLDPAGVRTLAMVAEPVPARASRRRINAESVSIEGQLRLRERHAFRVPVQLQQAHAEVDEREEQLNAGFPEYAYLALVCVTAASRQELEAACQALADTAAACGIVELRALHGRHDAAWACTLPIGRAPDRELFAGGAAR